MTVDAGVGREMIRKKIEEWKIGEGEADKSPKNSLNHSLQSEKEPTKKRTRPVKAGKRDLRGLARELGLEKSSGKRA